MTLRESTVNTSNNKTTKQQNSPCVRRVTDGYEQQHNNSKTG